MQPEWELGPEILHDFSRAATYEWLETDGQGGFAGSTVSGAHTRRYHGLLVAATRPPVGRRVLLSRLDETLETPAGTCELSAHQYPGAVHPRGFEHLARFRRGLFPVFDFTWGDIELRKTIACVHAAPGSAPVTLVLYDLLAAPGPVRLRLQPFYAGRDYHALTQENDAVHRAAAWSGETLAYRSYDGEPEVFLHVPGATYEPAPDWYRRFQYAREQERGLDFEEDLFTPGHLTIDLAPGARVGILISTAEPSGLDAWELFDRERERREDLLAQSSLADPLCRALVLAADQFLAGRTVGGEALGTVIAGYPWFTDWGRDTMIALPGLCLATGRLDEARRILAAFAGAVSAGMLPNRFPDGAEAPEYNTVDASLWFFVATWKYLEAGGDEGFVRSTLLPALREIHDRHRRGTRHGIHQDADGLLASGEPGVQLTWMDAKVGDWVVTPRRGKPVEIQALWVNALEILAALTRRFGDPELDGPHLAWAAALERLAATGRKRFGEIFWNAAAGCLYDGVDGETRDASVRPNQLFALSLPFPLLAGERAESVLAKVEAELLTPRGLRTLSPADPAYRPTCSGPQAERDAAYHQGTVWPWLLGPYLTALVRLRGETGRAQGREILARFAPHLGEAGVGTVSEIFDGDPPHAPRGCIAQAWSVAEILRAAVEDLGGPAPLAGA